MTARLFEELTFHLKEDKKLIIEGIVDGPLLDDQKSHFYSMLKGQILTFRKILDIKDFLLRPEEKDEVA